MPADPIETFDYIVVGGGSAGSVGAAGLPDILGATVLLEEAGREGRSPWIHIPATFFRVMRAGKLMITMVGLSSGALVGAMTTCCPCFAQWKSIPIW